MDSQIKNGNTNYTSLSLDLDTICPDLLTSYAVFQRFIVKEKRRKREKFNFFNLFPGDIFRKEKKPKDFERYSSYIIVPKNFSPTSGKIWRRK